MAGRTKASAMIAKIVAECADDLDAVYGRICLAILETFKDADISLQHAKAFDVQEDYHGDLLICFLGYDECYACLFGYGSCSGCDAVCHAFDYSRRSPEDVATDLMKIAQDIVTGLRPLTRAEL